MSIKIYCDRCGKELFMEVGQKEKIDHILLHPIKIHSFSLLTNTLTYQYEQELCSDCELLLIKKAKV